MKWNFKSAVSAAMAVIMMVAIGAVSPNKVYAAILEDAVSIELGEEVQDTLSDKTEEDWYTFTTPESEIDSWFEIVQMFSDKKESGYPPSLYLYDAKKKELLHVSPSDENEEEYGYVVLEAKSTYYVKIASEYHNDTADYSFVIKELGDEAGQTLETASDLEKNLTNRFELQSADDEDWFYVESDITMPTLTVKNAEVQALTVVIYDIDGIKLEEFEVDSSESETMSLKLEDKKFYVRVYSYYSTEESKGSYTIAVNDQINVTKVSLNKSKVELKAGKTITLKATITPDTATDKTVTWKSSDTRIATVDQKGKVVAKKAGAVTITCTANDGSNKKATCKITVR
jgi:plastocyanin